MKRFSKMAGTLPSGFEPIAAGACVLVPSAVFHSLSSIEGFPRWTYDNNPLIFLALAALFLSVRIVSSRGAGANPPSRIMLNGLVALLMLTAWTRMNVHFARVRSCSEPWGEIAFLEGARMRPSGQGMRDFVGVVRSLAPDASGDAVLLLPNDPNVEAWLERRRPTLAGAVVFSDQYWDRYVDDDFARLAENPPKVIAIGPRLHWRVFSRRWNRGRGAERLIDRVIGELLPGRYEFSVAQTIERWGNSDFMDIYVRVDEEEGGDGGEATAD